MIAPSPHALMADAYAAYVERIAQGNQMSKDHRLPITRVPETIARGMAGFRDLCCRQEGVEHASRYGTGLMLSPNKPRQGIDD
jgi:hypothetical protein